MTEGPSKHHLASAEVTVLMTCVEKKREYILQDCEYILGVAYLFWDLSIILRGQDRYDQQMSLYFY